MLGGSPVFGPVIEAGPPRDREEVGVVVPAPHSIKASISCTAFARVSWAAMTFVAAMIFLRPASCSSAYRA